jgi:hypothetical protein
VDAKTRALFLADFSGTCPAGQKVISWPAALDAALVTKLNITLADSRTSARNLSSGVARLSAELTADQKQIAQLQAAFAAEIRVSAKLLTLDEICQESQKELQQASDGDSAFLTKISKILKELADTESSLLSSLK